MLDSKDDSFYYQFKVRSERFNQMPESYINSPPPQRNFRCGRLRGSIEFVGCP